MVVNKTIDVKTCDAAHARERESQGISIRNLVVDHREGFALSSGSWSLAPAKETRAVLLLAVEDVEFVVMISGRSTLLAKLIVAKMTIVIVPR
jgi:hypothetical protein